MRRRRSPLDEVLVLAPVSRGPGWRLSAYQRPKGRCPQTSSLGDFMASFMRHKEGSGTIEPPAVREYRAETKQIDSRISSVSLAELPIDDVFAWMRDMGADGCAPRAAPSSSACPSGRLGGPSPRPSSPRIPATSAGCPSGPQGLDMTERSTDCQGSYQGLSTYPMAP